MGGTVFGADYDQTEHLGNKIPGDAVSATVNPPGTVLTGGVTDNGGWPWVGGPQSFSATVPQTFVGAHASRFDGTWTREGGAGGQGGSTNVLTWRMDTNASVSDKVLDIDWYRNQNKGKNVLLIDSVVNPGFDYNGILIGDERGDWPDESEILGNNWFATSPTESIEKANNYHSFYAIQNPGMEKDRLIGEQYTFAGETLREDKTFSFRKQLVSAQNGTPFQGSMNEVTERYFAPEAVDVTITKETILTGTMTWGETSQNTLSAEVTLGATYKSTISGGIPSVATGEIGASYSASLKAAVATASGTAFSDSHTMTTDETRQYTREAGKAYILQSYVGYEVMPVTVVRYKDEDADGIADSNNPTTEIVRIKKLLTSELRLALANVDRD